MGGASYGEGGAGGVSSGAIDDDAGGEIAVVEIGIRFAEFGDYLVDLVAKDAARTRDPAFYSSCRSVSRPLKRLLVERYRTCVSSIAGGFRQESWADFIPRPSSKGNSNAGQRLLNAHNPVERKRKLSTLAG